MTARYANKSAGWDVPGGAPWQGAVDWGITLLQRMGFVVGAMYVLAVPSRKSGVLRSTPVSLLTLEGERYIVACDEAADWVRDARAAGHGMLRRGRVDEHIALTEIPVTECIPVLRAFPRLVPGGVASFRRRHGIPADPDAFAGLAAVCPVFRVERG
jgi:hypothetical protein